MTDRELLELAAKAARYPQGRHRSLGGLLMSNELYWNPLVDDGDALRLAVQLRINLDFSRTVTGRNGWGAGVVAVHYNDPKVRHYTEVLEHLCVEYIPEEMFSSTEHNDARMAVYYMESGEYVRGVNQATRRAIVLAAAAIGRNTQ